MSEQTKTLDEQLVDWLKERNAAIVFIARGPKSGGVTVDNFIYETGIHIPTGWQLDVTVVEAKPK